MVALNTCGLPDIVEHEVTGYLAKAFEPADLARGIQWVLEDSIRYKKLSIRARERALRLWSQDVVVPNYLEIYRNVISKYANNTANFNP